MRKSFQILLSAALAFILLAGAGACKKQIRKIQENIVLDVMTSGTWVVTRMEEGSSNTTAQFNGYEFQFYRNRTVDAILNGTKVQSGTWEALEAAQSIQANFSNVNGDLLPKLNGTWRIYSVSLTSVKSNQMIGGTEWKLDLNKK